MIGNDAFINKTLRANIMNDKGLLLLSKGTLLTSDYITRLNRNRYSLTINDIVNDDIQKNNIKSIISDNDFIKKRNIKKEDIINENELLVPKRISDVFRNYFDKNNKKIPIKEISSAIIPIATHLATNQNLFKIFNQLQSKTFLSDHALHVSIFATLIGKWLKLSKLELEMLSIGGALHNLGLTNISEEIINKETKLNEKELDIIKKHTIIGYELIKESKDISSIVSVMVLQHHEREDGSGYPLGLKGKQIEFLSKIISIADTFIALTADRPYRKALTFTDAIIELKKLSGNQLDLKIILMVIEQISKNQKIGSNILLSNGNKGKIIMLNPSEPLYPLIETNKTFLDLSKNRDIKITSIY